MSVRIDNSADYLQRTANVPSVTSFTICGWCRVKEFRNNWQYIAALEDDTSEAGHWAAIGFSWSGVQNQLHISTDITGNGLYYYFTRHPIIDEWFFFAMSRSGNASGNFKGYVARESDETLETVQNSSDMSDFTPASMPFMNDSYTEWANGELAHVRVWNTVLTQTQIEAEWASATLVNTSNVNLVYRLANSADTNDISGNGYNPTIGGTLSDGSGDPPVGSGLLISAQCGFNLTRTTLQRMSSQVI